MLSLTSSDVLQVRPSEAIPADNVVIENQSEADESWLTGESRAVIKRDGDRVACGSINGSGSLTVENPAARVRPSGSSRPLISVEAMIVSAGHPLLRHMRPSALSLAGVMLGCGTERIELGPATRAVTSPPADATPPLAAGEASPVTTGGGQGATPVALPGRDGALVPDVELLPPEAPETGCTKIDFLFVIDNSSSMRDEQQNLASSFPGFVQVMQQVVDVTDYHVMVVSTSGDQEEEDEPALDPDACEEIQGAGRRRSRDGDDCGIQAGLSYMSQDQPELEATFACVEIGRASCRERV